MYCFCFCFVDIITTSSWRAGQELVLRELGPVKVRRTSQTSTFLCQLINCIKIIHTVDSLYFVGYLFSWISWVAQFTNLKLQQYIIYFFKSFLDKANAQIQVPTK